MKLYVYQSDIRTARESIIAGGFDIEFPPPQGGGRQRTYPPLTKDRSVLPIPGVHCPAKHRTACTYRTHVPRTGGSDRLTQSLWRAGIRCVCRNPYII